MERKECYSFLRKSSLIYLKTSINLLVEICRKGTMRVGKIFEFLLQNMVVLMKEDISYTGTSRLSGMNMILDNLDYPLIIKVASQPVRCRSIIDNERFFSKENFHE